MALDNFIQIYRFRNGDVRIDFFYDLSLLILSRKDATLSYVSNIKLTSIKNMDESLDLVTFITLDCQLKEIENSLNAKT